MMPLRHAMMSSSPSMRCDCCTRAPCGARTRVSSVSRASSSGDCCTHPQDVDCLLVIVFERDLQRRLCRLHAFPGAHPHVACGRRPTPRSARARALECDSAQTRHRVASPRQCPSSAREDAVSRCKLLDAPPRATRRTHAGTPAHTDTHTRTRTTHTWMSPRPAASTSSLPTRVVYMRSCFCGAACHGPMRAATAPPTRALLHACLQHRNAFAAGIIDGNSDRVLASLTQGGGGSGGAQGLVRAHMQPAHRRGCPLTNLHDSYA